GGADDVIGIPLPEYFHGRRDSLGRFERFVDQCLVASLHDLLQPQHSINLAIACDRLLRWHFRRREGGVGAGLNRRQGEQLAQLLVVRHTTSQFFRPRTLWITRNPSPVARGIETPLFSAACCRASSFASMKLRRVASHTSVNGYSFR